MQYRSCSLYDLRINSQRTVTTKTKGTIITKAAVEADRVQVVGTKRDIGSHRMAQTRRELRLVAPRENHLVANRPVVTLGRMAVVR